MGETVKKDEVGALIETAKKEGCNLLMPTTDIIGVADQHAIILERTTISLDPEDGEIYEDDSRAAEGDKKRFRLHKTALMRLSRLGGIKWWPSESGIEKIEKDNRGKVVYIAFKSCGSIMSPDGQEIPFVGHDDLDFIVLEEKYREQYEAKTKYLKKGEKPNLRDATAQEKADYIDYCVKRDLMQKQDHKLAIVETGAMERVIRGALGLKNSYSQKQLKCPFVVARIAWTPDYANPVTRQQALTGGTQARRLVYGPDSSATGLKSPIDIAPKPEDGKQPDTDPSASLLADFDACSIAEKEAALLRLADKVKYNLTNYLAQCGKKKLTELKAETLATLFKHLNSLLPPKPTAEEDVPF